MKNLYPNLASELQAHNLTNAIFAKMIGMAKTTLYRRFSGETEWKLHEVVTICEVLDCYDVKYLFLRLDYIS